MKTFNLRQAKMHLLRLVLQAAKGEPFVIAKGGTPLVVVKAVAAPGAGTLRRLDFLAGEILVPDDFDRMGGREIRSMYLNRD